MADIRGTWLLQEVRDEAHLTGLAPKLSAILRTTDVTGLSIRVEWDRAVSSMEDIFDLGLTIADDKLFAGRVMAGRNTPEPYRGRTMVYDGSSTGGKYRGEIIPLCFGNRGRRNEVFFDGMIDLYDRQVAWAVENGSPLVHLPWPGLIWAELALIRQMMEQSGYTYEVVRDFHRDLMRHALDMAGPELTVEFATSGHVDDKRLRPDIQAVLATHPNGDYYGMLSTNNVSSAITGLPLGNQQRRYGAQMVDLRNDHDWAKVYLIVEDEGDNPNEYAEYLEVYTESFAGGTSDELRRQITAHAPESGNGGDSLGHTVTVIAPSQPAATLEGEGPAPGEWGLPAHSVDMIQQLYSPSVSGLATKVAAAMKNTDGLLTGFGTRIPAKYPVIDLMDDSLDIADVHDIAYRPRTMMGGHIPEDVKAAMGSKFLFDGTGAMQGQKCPRPTDGTNVNQVFLDYYRTHVRAVFKWCALNGVDLFNVPTVGMAYSELYFGPEVQNDRAGWLKVHKMLVDIVAEEQTPGVTAGWGLSGHGPFFTPVDMGLDLARHIKAKMPAPDQSEGQGNGWGPNGIWGQSSSSTETQMDKYLTTTGLVPGAQAIQPWNTGSSGSMAMLSTQQFAAAFGQLDRIDARQLEVYLDTPATDTTKRMVPFLTEFLG